MADFRPFSVLLLSALSIGVMATFPAYAQEGNDTDWKKGKWGHLAPLIGTYQLQTVLDDPQVSAALDKVIDEKQKKIFMKNMDVTSPIGFDGDCLVITGNAEEGGNSETAFLNVCLYAGKVHVGIQSDSSVMVYASEDTYNELPLSLRQWAYGTKDFKTFWSQPSYVQMTTIPD